MSAPIVVVFPDEATLAAACEAIGIIVSAQDGREDTPHYRAERVLDGALLAHEEGL